MGKLNIINRTALRYLNKGVNLLDFFNVLKMKYVKK